MATGTRAITQKPIVYAAGDLINIDIMNYSGQAENKRMQTDKQPTLPMYSSERTGTIDNQASKSKDDTTNNNQYGNSTNSAAEEDTNQNSQSRKKSVFKKRKQADQEDSFEIQEKVLIADTNAGKSEVVVRGLQNSANSHSLNLISEERT